MSRSDVHSKKIRSYNMSRIRSKDTKPEMIVRKYLFSNGIRYRLHYEALPGNPDLVILKKKYAIQINGCFWHGHKNCSQFKLPRSNKEWWLKKISKNIERDKKNYKLLSDKGWKVTVVWDCQLNPKKREKTLAKLLRCLRQ